MKQALESFRERLAFHRWLRRQYLNRKMKQIWEPIMGTSRRLFQEQQGHKDPEAGMSFESLKEERKRWPAQSEQYRASLECTPHSLWKATEFYATKNLRTSCAPSHSNISPSTEFYSRDSGKSPNSFYLIITKRQGEILSSSEVSVLTQKN